MIEFIKSAFKEIENRAISFGRTSKYKRPEKKNARGHVPKTRRRDLIKSAGSEVLRSRSMDIHQDQTSRKGSSENQVIRPSQPTKNLLPLPLLPKSLRMEPRAIPRKKREKADGKVARGKRKTPNRRRKNPKKKLPVWVQVKNINQEKRLTQPSQPTKVNPKIKTAGIARSSLGESILLLFSCGTYWGYWTKRVLFELSFVLGIEIEEKRYSVLRPFFQYISYTRAIRHLVLTAERRTKISLHQPEFFEFTQYFPPLFVYYCQKTLNRIYERASF